MPNKIEPIIFLIFGVYLVVFRKTVVRYNEKIRLKHMKPRKKEEYAQLQTNIEKAGFSGFSSKLQEIGCIVAGVIFVVTSSQALFFPQLHKYFDPIITFAVISFFAAIISIGAFVPIGYFVWRKVRKRIEENNLELYERAYNSPMPEKAELIKSYQPIDDPVLHRLRVKATVYSIVCYILLFAVFLVGLYEIIRATNPK